MTDIAEQPTITPAPAEPTREYTAGMPGWLAYRGAVRALPHAVDDLEAELGDELYTRMLRDPRVAGDIGLLKAQILADGVSFSPAATPDGDERAAAIAAEAKAFVDRCMAKLDIGLHDVLDNLLDALAYGAKVAEQVYKLADEGDDRGRLVLKALKVKPRKSVAFAVDPYLNVIGMLVAEPGRPLSTSALLQPGATPPRNLLPRGKFAVLSYKPKDADPRGSTVLRAAYNFWWIKTQLLPELLKYGVLFGSPSLFGTTPEKPAGTQENAQQELLTQLLDFAAGTAIAAAYGTLLEVIEATPGGEAFFDKMLERCDQQISIAIYGATRATQEAKNGSRADSDTAKDLFDSIVDAARQAIATMLQRDVVAPLLAYNSAEWAKYPPTVAVGGVKAEDRTPAWTAVAQLERAGYFDPSQYQPLDAQLGLPVRTPEEVEARRAPPPAPTPAPGQLRPAPEPDDEENDDAAA